MKATNCCVASRMSKDMLIEVLSLLPGQAFMTLVQSFGKLKQPVLLPGESSSVCRREGGVTVTCC